jgi:hypothetical protein
MPCGAGPARSAHTPAFPSPDPWDIYSRLLLGRVGRLEMDFGSVEKVLAERDVPGLCRALTALYPNDPALDRLPELARFALIAGSAMPRLPGPDASFAASIAASRNFWLDPDSGLRSLHLINRRTIPVDLDFLGDRTEPRNWGVARALNHLLLNQIRPTRRSAVVGTMRDDGLYLLEWVAHYLALGFEGIFIYTNDNADGSELLLRRLADHRVITLIESETAGTVRPEVKAFEHALHLLHDLRDYAWVLFVDSDEFFQPGDAYRFSIANVLDDIAERFGDQPPAAILYEWLWYNSGMAFGRTPGLLAERFQYASPHWLTKPLVCLRETQSMRRQHVPDFRAGGFVVDSSLSRIDVARVWERRPPQYTGGRINHFWPKSFEEFSLKKARGDALPLADDEYRRDFRLFFEWNGPETPETYHAVDRSFVTEVKRTIQHLRMLDGVAAFEANVNDRFRRLLGRYDTDGGLHQIYRRLKPDSNGFGVPTSP